MDSMYQQLMRLPLFQGISTEKITALVEKLPFHFLKYNGREQIFSAGDACTHIKFIVSGQVKLETPFTHLRVSMVQTVAAPHVLAAEYLFGRETVYPYTAVADGPCGILQLLKSDYVKMINSDKVFLFNILNYLSSGSQRSSSSALSVKGGTVAERLALLVDTMAVAGASDIVLNYKQKDLCAVLGTKRTTFVTAMNKLSKDEILSYDTNQLKILNPQALAAMIG